MLFKINSPSGISCKNMDHWVQCYGSQSVSLRIRIQKFRNADPVPDSGPGFWCPKKRESRTSKHEISSRFSIFGVILSSWIRIRIRLSNAESYPDPATKTNADLCGSGSTTLYVTFSALGFKKELSYIEKMSNSLHLTVRHGLPAIYRLGIVAWC